MKRTLISLAAVAVLATTACSDFLTIDPVSVVSETKLLNQDGVDMLTTAMYSTLYSSGISSSLSSVGYGDVIAGNANKGSNANDQPAWGELEVFTFSGTNGYITGPWSSFYNGVYRANKVLDLLSKVGGLDAAYVTQRTAEARFIRGLYHLVLVEYYGSAIPYVSMEDMQANVSPKVSNKDESGNYIYIWDKIIADFEFAYNNLPDSYSNGEIGRPNKWAALAFKAKTEVFMSSPYNGKNGTVNKWADAKTDLANLVANGKTSSGAKYALIDNYGDLFSTGHDNSSESVFAIQQTIVGTSTNGNVVWGSGQYNGISNLAGWGFSQPSTDLSESYKVDANGLPFLANGYRTAERTSKPGNGTNIITDLSVYMDPRIDFNLGRCGIPFMDWDVPTSYDGYIRAVENGGIFFPKKWLPTSADKNGGKSVSGSATSTTKDFNLIRYADILLWYAEALVQTGTPAEALPYVNMVRERAGNDYVGAARRLGSKFNTGVEATTSTYVMDNLFDSSTGANAASNYRIGPWTATQFATAASAMEAIRYESRAEFACEGRYWFDLCRWGIAAQELNAYAAYESRFLPKYEKAVYNELMICLPIPAQQILIMSGLLHQSETWDF